jgi:Tfp pilus assembly protein PilZ
MRSGQAKKRQAVEWSLTMPRVHPRYALEIDAELAYGGIRAPARTRDMSRGGLSVLTREPIPVGLEITVTISLVAEEQTMSEPLPLRGRIVWCTALEEGRYQVGTTFIGLTGEQRAYVELFMRYLEDG